MSRRIQVFEHERLTLHKNRWGQSITESELQKLYSFNDRHNHKYFTGIRDGVKFKSYVGVIQIGGLTLEILPKADKLTNSTEEAHSKEIRKWQNVLLRMLAVTRHIRVESVSESSLKRRQYSILDLYFELFLNEVENLLHRGLVKKYRKAEGNLSVLKGRIDFNQNIQRNLIHQEHFYTHHQVYDQDHLINQILFRALTILNRMRTSSYLNDRLARMMLDLPEIKQINIQAFHFDLITEDRKNIHYREALKIARMIILNFAPDIKGGAEDFLALLFDMNKLWEEYIYRMIVKCKTDDIEVGFQNTKTFWQSDALSRSICPDLVIKKGNEAYIVDTKWKVIDSLKPDDEDLKQIFSYNLYWKSYHSMLLYPSTTKALESIQGKYKEGLTKEHGCTLAFVDILDEAGGLNKDCGQSILRLLGGSCGPGQAT